MIKAEQCRTTPSVEPINTPGTHEVLQSGQSISHGGPVDALGLTVELPLMPHCAPDYPADPDCGKLSAVVLVALERLPL